MKWRHLTAFNFIVLLFLVVAGFYLFFRTPENTNELVLYGNVDVREVQIGFRVAGKVATVQFEEGDRVQKGALMATLAKDPYDHQVVEAKASLKALEVNLANAAKLFLRRKELIEIGGVSREDLDNAEATFLELKASVMQSEAALKVAEDNLSYTEVFAPTDGIILTRIREAGSVVAPSDPVYTLSISSPIWIRAFVDEPDLGRVTYGMKAKVYTDVKGAPIFEGRVGFISPVAEFTPKTVQTTTLRTDLVYRLRIYVDDPKGMLLQGMPVTVKFELPPK